MPKSKNKRKKSTQPSRRAQRETSYSDQDDTLVDIVEARDQAQDFFERNQSKIIGFTAALLLLVGGYLIYKYLIKAPKEAEAMESMAEAEFQFKQDSFALALNNPGGEYDGFAAIADNYGSTSAGNLAKYYAGICNLQLNDFNSAISYLESFKPAGTIAPIMKYGALADAYSENQDFDKALSLYQKASTSGNNSFMQAYYLKKLGLLYRRNGDNVKAAAAFNSIKNDHPNSLEANDIDKYINLVN